MLYIRRALMLYIRPMLGTVSSVSKTGSSNIQNRIQISAAPDAPRSCGLGAPGSINQDPFVQELWWYMILALGLYMTGVTHLPTNLAAGRCKSNFFTCRVCRPAFVYIRQTQVRFNVRWAEVATTAARLGTGHTKPADRGSKSPGFESACCCNGDIFYSLFFLIAQNSNSTLPSASASTSHRQLPSPSIETKPHFCQNWF